MGIGYLASSFDLLNVEHLDVIAQARARCEELVIGVFPDELVSDLKGRPPVVPLHERMALVGHVRGVRQVVVHDHRAAPTGADGSTFSMAGDASADLVDAVPLVPGRQTASHVLRAALRPLSDEAVA